MLNQEEIVLHPINPEPNTKLHTMRFPLYQVLHSANSVLCLEKLWIDPTIAQGQTQDFLVLITSDLLIHTLELKEQSNDDSTGSH